MEKAKSDRVDGTPSQVMQVAGAVVGDGERVAVLLVAEHELALVVGAPEAVGLVGADRAVSLSLVAPALAALDQAIAIEHGMHGADGRRLDHRELLDQLVADLAGTPGGVLLLDPEDRALDLEGQPVGLPVRCPAAVVEAVEAAVFVAVEDLVAGDSGDAELTAQRCHLLALEEPGYETKSLIHRFTLIPRHLGSPQMPYMCKPCVRNNL